MAESKPYKIRKAKATDVVALVELMKEAHVSDLSLYPPIDDFDCLKWVMRMVEQGGVWVAIADRKIVGSIGCNVDTFAWNKNSAFICNEWYYVRPQYRKGYDIAKKLLDEAKATAQEAKLPFIFSINSGKDKMIDYFVQRRGFKYMGGIAAIFPPVGEPGNE